MAWILSGDIVAGDVIVDVFGTNHVMVTSVLLGAGGFLFVTEALSADDDGDRTTHTRVATASTRFPIHRKRSSLQSDAPKADGPDNP